MQENIVAFVGLQERRRLVITEITGCLFMLLSHLGFCLDFIISFFGIFNNTLYIREVGYEFCHLCYYNDDIVGHKPVKQHWFGAGVAYYRKSKDHCIYYYSNCSCCKILT